MRDGVPRERLCQGLRRRLLSVGMGLPSSAQSAALSSPLPCPDASAPSPGTSRRAVEADGGAGAGSRTDVSVSPPSPAPERERSRPNRELGRGSWAPSRTRGPWQGFARLGGWRRCCGSVRVGPWVRPAAPGFQPGTGPHSPSRGPPGFAPRAGLSPLGEPSEAAAAAEAEQLLITHVQQREKNAIP